tara:strand:- start:1661 stop:2707 length:1047 start_codon:yes stop_codon:yes gene_type:complete
MDGQLDTDFDIGSGLNGEVKVILPVNDGSGDIIVGGNFTQYRGLIAGHIVRIAPTGLKSVQDHFGVGFNNDVEALMFDSNGKLHIGGSFTSYQGNPTVTRYTRVLEDGSVDPGYDVDANDTVYSIAETANGRFYIGGAFTTVEASFCNYVCRILDNGTVDNTFTGVGNGNAFDDNVNDIVIQENNAYFGGRFNQYNIVLNRNGIIKLDTNGNTASSFDIGSSLVANSGFDSSVGVLHLDSSTENLLVGGGMNQYKGTSVAPIVRLLPNGSLDPVFTANVTSTTTGTVFGIAREPLTGELYVAGEIGMFNGEGISATGELLRLDSNGKLIQVIPVKGDPIVAPTIIELP